VTVEIERESATPKQLLPKIDEWVEKLVSDRMGGIKRATKAFTKGSRRYKAWIDEIAVERADD